MIIYSLPKIVYYISAYLKNYYDHLYRQVYFKELGIHRITVVYVWVTKGTSIERVCVCHVNVNHYKYRH